MEAFFDPLPPLPLRNDPPYAPEQMSVVLDGMIIKPREAETPKLPNEGFHGRSRRSRPMKRKEEIHGGQIAEGETAGR
jgi:hypothetical protein